MSKYVALMQEFHSLIPSGSAWKDIRLGLRTLRFESWMDLNVLHFNLYTYMYM